MQHTSSQLFLLTLLSVLLIGSTFAIENINQFQSFVIAADAQPSLHWAVELDCDSAVRISTKDKEQSHITLDDGICRALCSQFKEKDMSKNDLARAFARHSALDCRFAYSDALYIPTPLCLGGEGNFIFTVSNPLNIKKLILISSRVEAFWKMRLDADSREGACVNGSRFLYNYENIPQKEYTEISDSRVISLGNVGGKYVCAHNWTNSEFNMEKYSPGILSRIDQLDFLAVNISKAISVDMRMLKLPFIIQLNNRDCFGSLHPLKAEGGLILYFERYLSDLETWL